MLRIARPKTPRARRVLERRAPKLHEDQKKALFLHGTKASAAVKGVLSDLYHLKKAGGNATKLSRKNDAVRPFEGGGEASLEFMSLKTDCSLFAFGSHSKKRPHNLVLGRMFDHHIYDLVELGVDRYRSIAEFRGGGKHAPQEGSKPCFVFVGDEFETKPEYRQLKSILLDFFRGEDAEGFNLAGLDRVFICIAAAGKVWLRHCGIRLKKSGTTVPRLELVEVGPFLDLSLRRTREAGEELQKEAHRTVTKTTKKKIKNVSTDSLAGKIGRIYMPKQEVREIALNKMKGLKRQKREAAAARSQGSQDRKLAMEYGAQREAEQQVDS
eukprot:SM000053S17400  [mRNA]  locus=s53:123370:125639:- [translate_table: standard]